MSNAPKGKPPVASQQPSYTGFASRVSSFANEHQFLRSFYSRPTSAMDEHGNNIYPFGDERVIMPTQRDVRQAGLVATEPKERFPAVSLQDGQANYAQDYLRGLIAGERSGVAFSNYEIRLAIRRLGGEGVAFTEEFVAGAFGNAQTAQDALVNLIDTLWSNEDSLCRKLTRPIPPPVSMSEV